MRCGIDYSSTSAAIYVEDDQGVGKWYCQQDILKYVREEQNLSITRVLKFERKIERSINMANWALGVLQEHGITETNIEGLSFGSVGSMIIDMAAHAGILYAKLIENGIKVNLIPPKNAKLSFAGSGTADKELMCNTFKEKLGFCFSDVLNSKPNESPENDLVDAYAIAYSEPLLGESAKKMFC